MSVSRSELTFKEKIALHLYNNRITFDMYNMPFCLTQDGIANACGISRAHSSVELKKLREDGYVSMMIAHTNGSKVKRNVYLINEDANSTDYINGILNKIDKYGIKIIYNDIEESKHLSDNRRYEKAIDDIGLSLDILYNKRFMSNQERKEAVQKSIHYLLEAINELTNGLV